MKQQVKYKDKLIEYTLKWSNRKTLGLKVTKDSEVIVTAPIGISKEQAKDFVQKKAKWIYNKLALVQEKNDSKPVYQYKTGEKFYFLGNEYELHIVYGECHPPITKLEDNKLIVKIHKNYVAEKIPIIIKSEIKRLFVDKALGIITDRVNHFAEIIGLYPKKLTLREQKTRWGSCSSKGNLSINWRIVIAPLEIVDYIVIHELCHLKEMNHSTAFWYEVEKYCPNYKQHEKWLKDNGNRLII